MAESVIQIVGSTLSTSADVFICHSNNCSVRLQRQKIRTKQYYHHAQHLQRWPDEGSNTWLQTMWSIH